MPIGINNAVDLDFLVRRPKRDLFLHKICGQKRRTRSSSRSILNIAVTF